MLVHRFTALDGLRGICAIAVMIYHFSGHNGLNYLPGAWVAVDLFFVLSGFVIAHSYGPKILGGLSFKGFILSRLIRLAPMYMVGLMLGVFAAIQATTVSSLQIVKIALLGVFLIPYDGNIAWPFGFDFVRGSIFPLNDPAWSLFFELFVNVAFFYFALNFRRIYIFPLVVVAYMAFIALTLATRQINGGWAWDDMYLGFPRVIATFFCGVLIYGFKPKIKPSISIALSVLIVLLFIVSSAKVAFLNSLFLVPLTVLFLSVIYVGGTAKLVCNFLGEISYPLYIVHFPIFRFLYPMIAGVTSPLMQIFLVSIFTIALSYALSRFDVAVRAILKRHYNLNF